MGTSGTCICPSEVPDSFHYYVSGRPRSHLRSRQEVALCAFCTTELKRVLPILSGHEQWRQVLSCAQTLLTRASTAFSFFVCVICAVKALPTSQLQCMCGLSASPGLCLFHTRLSVKTYLPGLGPLALTKTKAVNLIQHNLSLACCVFLNHHQNLLGFSCLCSLCFCRIAYHTFSS
jgi:hypothetical protein